MRWSQYDMWKLENILEKELTAEKLGEGESVRKMLKTIHLFAFVNGFFQWTYFFVFFKKIKTSLNTFPKIL